MTDVCLLCKANVILPTVRILLPKTSGFTSATFLSKSPVTFLYVLLTSPPSRMSQAPLKFASSTLMTIMIFNDNINYIKSLTVCNFFSAVLSFPSSYVHALFHSILPSETQNTFSFLTARISNPQPHLYILYILYTLQNNLSG